NGRLIPAVEYLRAQRVRMMMMEKLAKATESVDVYLVGANPFGDGGGRGRGEGRGPSTGSGRAGDAGARAAKETAAVTTTAPPEPQRPQSATQRHFAMANLACYPA